jgi:predicted secreted hydrolase
MRRLLIPLAILILSLALWLPGLLSRRKGGPVQANLISASAMEVSGFAQVQEPRSLHFPADHGPHPEYQTEWWYYTGNLDSPDGRHFGYQLTFFRRALLPPDQFPERISDWATSQVYMAHFALTDITGRRFQAYERLGRGAAGLAGARAAPFQVWLEDWRVEETAPGEYQLKASKDGFSLDLRLNDTKGPVLQGDRGYSRKGSQPGQASYYYSLTRLASTGQVSIGDQTYQVEGLSWMDHEFSTSYLSEDQVGWDWFALQFDEGSELMVFRIRTKDGSADPYSSGTLVAPDGSSRNLNRDDFQISVKETWESPRTNAVYPARWVLEIPEAGISLEIEPYLADQELDVAYIYWEGAVRLRGEYSGRVVQGSGYVELTGYARSLGGEF